MRKRNIFKVFCLVCYVALLILFFVYSKTRKDSSEQESCIESACLRLCKTEQNSKFLNETIDDFEVTNPVTNLTLKYQVLNENPCESMRILENDQWKFSVSVTHIKKTRKLETFTVFLHRVDLFWWTTLLLRRTNIVSSSQRKMRTKLKTHGCWLFAMTTRNSTSNFTSFVGSLDILTLIRFRTNFWFQCR